MSPKTIRILTAVLAATGGVMSISDKLEQIPGLPPSFSQWWPAVLAFATVVDRIGHALLDTKPLDTPPKTDRTEQ